MNCPILFLLLFFQFEISCAQNLIQNGSFENHTNCPITGDILNAPPWESASALPAQLFDSCANQSTYYFGVPINLDSLLGYQKPKTGNAYAGMNLYLDINPNTRQYLKYVFNKSLSFNKKYCLTFYVNLVNSSRYAVDAIGAYFSDSSLYCPSIPCLLNYMPQIVNPAGNILKDTLGWTKVSGSFTSKGNENYMIIGNFTPDSLVQKTINRFIPSWDYSTYYYIDDVSLIEVSDSIEIGETSSLSFPNVFSPNNDGLNDFFIADAKNIVNFSCKIYNRYGVLVNTIKDLDSSWDGHSTSGVPLPEGVYYYHATAKGEDEKDYNLKGFVSLFR